MGVEKALLPFRGTTLLERVVQRLAHLSDDLLIVSNNPDIQKMAIRATYPDLTPGAGPLGGIYTGLHYAKHPAAVIVACDMPFVNPDLLTEEVRLLEAMAVDVVIPAPDGKTEPLHAAYRRDICLPNIRAALDTGLSRLISWHPQVRVHPMEAEAIRAFDPDLISFININTPDELRAAELRMD